MSDEVRLGMLVNALHAGAASADALGLTKALQADMRSVADKLDAQLSAIKRARA